jgi:hypothetical protein
MKEFGYHEKLTKFKNLSTYIIYRSVFYIHLQHMNSQHKKYIGEAAQDEFLFEGCLISG